MNAAKRYLSQASLRSEASISALVPLLIGKRDEARNDTGHGHHLVWSLFAQDPGSTRDYLWHERRPGVFIILSARIPEDRHRLFDIEEPKVFEPALEPGDRLGFRLRASPVVREQVGERRHANKHDIVMNALRDVPKEERALHRPRLVQERGRAWIARQGERNGFEVGEDEVVVQSYTQHRVRRGRGRAHMRYSSMEFDGILTVTDPERLIAGVAAGFGAAKSQGQGLMLLRRSPG